MGDRYAEMRAALPASYVEYIEAHDGWEGDLGDDLGYVVLWSKAAIQERWDMYAMAEFLGDRWFPFGSNGGGEMHCFDLGSGDDAVYWLPFIGMGDEDALLQYRSFEELARGIRGA